MFHRLPRRSSIAKVVTLKLKYIKQKESHCRANGSATFNWAYWLQGTNYLQVGNFPKSWIPLWFMVNSLERGGLREATAERKDTLYIINKA